MNINEANLNDIKVAIFDFDDTLAFHQNREFFRSRRESGGDYFNYYTNAYLHPESFYEENEPCVPSAKLKNLIDLLRTKEVKLYCLSGMRFSFHLQAKQNFVDRHYGKGIEVISSCGQETKTDAVKILGQINGCEMREILFIDDMEENIAKMKELGVRAVLPSKIT